MYKNVITIAYFEMPLQGRRGGLYGGSYFPGDHGPAPRREPDPIQEFRLGLENEIVRMRPNPQRDNGLVIRMQGDQRVGDPGTYGISRTPCSIQVVA